ncbi:type II secretion system protein [Deferribacteres bacterium DY0037]
MFKGVKGFSLVEMAIVLIIFGLVLASASSILTLFVNKGGAERTRKMIEANRNVLVSVAASDGYLLDFSDSNRDSDSKLKNKLTYPNDAYSKKFMLLTAPSLGVPEAKKGIINDYSPVCGTKGTEYKLRLCDDDDCVSGGTVVNDIAFVIISGSLNKNIQTALDEDTGEVKVYPQGAEVDNYAEDFSRVEKYDDIVDWMTLPELRTKAGCEPEKLDFLDTNMPDVEEGEEYDYTIYGKGGVPFVQFGADDVPEYEFKLLSDADGFLDTDIRITVEPGGLGLDAEGDKERGEYLWFHNSSSTLAKNSYRVKIVISDDSTSGGQNEITRTLYIIKRN